MGREAGTVSPPLPACLAWTLFYISADAGAPIYFYEFQHRPQCFKDTKPAFVKADHSDEIRFVFGGAFLKGDVVMFGKEEEAALGSCACRNVSVRELRGTHDSPLLAPSPSTAPKLQENPEDWFSFAYLIYGLQT